MTITAATTRANARKNTHGFGWANLSSTDYAAGAEFYGRVFGWSWQEMPIGENMVHRNAQIGENMIAGMDPMMPGSDWPTAWTNYVFVEDINATVTSAKQLGATIAMEPMDVMGEGHMAVVVDPQGAVFGLWQPGRHTGADAVNQPGAYTWVELATDDLEGARRFYGELFGWGWEKQDVAGMEYWMAMQDGRGFAGLMNKPEQMSSMPSNWGTYFGVADVDAAATEVKAAGGKLLFEPMQMGPGKGFAALDPQNGYFMAIQLDEWPTD